MTDHRDIRPERLDRLPEQFFGAILAAAARARADPAPGLAPFIDLGRGNPDLPPPTHAIAALQAAAGEIATPVVHGYPPFAGHDDLREAIALRYRADHGVELDAEREIAVVPGTKTGIMLACLAAADRGDTILLPDPGYPDYPSGVALAGATIRPLPLDESTGFQPDLDAVAGGPDPALAVLNYPSNPTSACERPGTFEAAVAFAHDRGCWLMHDLAYGFLGFERRARSVLEVPGAREVAIELWSPSKIYGMAGWRVGFAVGAHELIARIQLLLDHLACGVWTGLQRGLSAALRSDQADVAQRRETYRARRDLLVGALRGAGAHVAPAEGSFYVWWRLPDGLTPERLIAEARVGVAPGEGFGARGAGWARLSLAVPDADLAEAAGRLAAATAARR
ncbi:aminotransferase class I/II-fold pyridoxal phosphate-dependent enzyme [Baekduia soli]|uniref:Aminotransferase class I/II-fold pyridoxal phosphate-dependent enzyme n=1 Tax=Baekduia soli TaxID=496014 RepID=A0A5B8U8X1_9ACTN|nr:aminotransferase class I/II-fold pyridoxal phosphate-dependent enzyme [Baekduia soli]QEC49082.1 aminotransferase class I/II-fold pyridoxal phosphate-dependent enzyme [Baekduia soli]